MDFIQHLIWQAIQEQIDKDWERLLIKEEWRNRNYRRGGKRSVNESNCSQDEYCWSAT